MMERPKIPEDSVSYKLFLNNDVDLDAARTNLLSSVSGYLLDYLWQNEPFTLEISDASLTEPDHLFGNVNFGDNIEDEWFIVFILLKMTEVDKDLVVRVSDNDGEFLLIEAADHLPKWLGPETSENRVWLHRGKVHIIPQPSTERDACLLPLYTPSVEEALKCVRCHGDLTEASETLQKVIQRRLAAFPAYIGEHLHRCNVELPLSAAAVLRLDRQTVSAAVHAFYYRDPLDVRACRQPEFFPPEGLVSWQVTLTRCMYAQLMQQQFAPDRRSGWEMLPATSPGAKAREMGMKLAHGLEIVCHHCRSGQTSQGREIVSMLQWDRFMRRLQSSGYFEGELEHSAKYKEKLKAAKNFFIDCIENQSGREAPASKILRLRQQFLENKEEQERQILDEAVNLPAEDDDAWMTVSPRQLEAMLDSHASKYFSRKRCEGDGDGAELAQAMHGFVKAKSAVEGVETVDRRAVKGRTPSSARHSELSVEDETEEEVKLDVGGILQSMHELLKLDGAEPGISSDDSDVEEYASSVDSEEEEEEEPGSRSGVRESAAARKARERHTQHLRGEVTAMQNYMRQMDEELRQHSGLGLRPNRARLADSEDLDSDDLSEEEAEAVGANIAKSMEAEERSCGPATAILSGLSARAANQNGRAN